MTCRHCGCSYVHRSRRRGVWENAQSFFGLWPYRCQRCGLRFAARGRHSDRRPTTTPSTGSRIKNESAASSPSPEGPAMAFRTHTDKPQAKIIVRAESHEQLNQILLSLDRAIHSYQKSGNLEHETTG